MGNGSWHLIEMAEQARARADEMEPHRQRLWLWLCRNTDRVRHRMPRSTSTGMVVHMVIEEPMLVDSSKPLP